MKKNIGILIASIMFAGAAIAQTATDTSTSFTKPAHQALYAKAGFPGVGLGYAYGIDKSFGLRGDFTTMGSYSINDTSGKFDYEGDLKYNQVGIYGDWFPMANNFRLTAGLQFRDAKASAIGRPNSADIITIGDVDVLALPGDTAQAQIKFPSTAPYLGIGWGLNTAANKAGWSVFADLGVTIGKPKVSLNVSDSLGAKLDLATGGNGQLEVDKQVADFRKDANKVKFVPQFFIGAAYKF